MAKQLVYTSVPQGLWPGTSGYCTVLSTEGIPRVQADFLEKLSVYRIADRQNGAAIPPTQENYELLVSLNPSNVAHVKFAFRGRDTGVLFRTGLAGFDYSNRLRKLSHFLILNDQDRTEAGPAWLSAQSNVFANSWGGNPTTLDKEKELPEGNEEPAVCQTWEKITGDAGWAGELARTVLPGGGVAPVYVVIPPAADALPLLREAVAILPPAQRWEVTFATNFVSLPQGIQCRWRFIQKDSPEYQAARATPDKVLIDLTMRLPAPEDGPEVQAAREGRLVPVSPAAAPLPVEPVSEVPEGDTATELNAVEFNDDPDFEWQEPTEETGSAHPTDYAAPATAAPRRGRLHVEEPEAPPVEPPATDVAPPALPPAPAPEPPPLHAESSEYDEAEDEEDEESDDEPPPRRGGVSFGLYALAAIGSVVVLGMVVFVTLAILKGIEPDTPVAQADPYEFNMGEENTLSVSKGDKALLDNDQPPGKLQVLKINGELRTDSWTPLPNYPGVELQVYADGSFKLDVSEATDLIALPQGGTKEITFNYLAGTIGNKPKESAVTDVTVTVWGVNDLPVAKADKYELSESDPFSPIKLNPLRRVEDPDTEDQHAVVAIAGQDAVSKGKVIKTPLGGEVEVVGGSKFLYFPNRDRLRSLNANQTYIDEFTYAVQDSAKQTPVEGTITVTSPGVDLPPLPKDDRLVLKKGETQLAFTEGDLKKNDENPEGGDLQLVAINNYQVAPNTTIPTKGKGTIQVHGEGRLVYLPPPNRDPYTDFNDILDYRVRSSGGEGVARFVVKIEAIPRPIPVTTLAEDFFNEMATAQYPLPEGFGRKRALVLKLPSATQRGPAEANVIATASKADLVPAVQLGMLDVMRTEISLAIKHVEGPAGHFVVIASIPNQADVPVAHFEFRQQRLHFYWDKDLTERAVDETRVLMMQKQLRVSIGEKGKTVEELFQFFEPIQFAKGEAKVIEFANKSRIPMVEEIPPAILQSYLYAFYDGDGGRYRDLIVQPRDGLRPRAEGLDKRLKKYLEKSETDPYHSLPRLHIAPVEYNQKRELDTPPGALALYYHTFDVVGKKDQGDPFNRETTWGDVENRANRFKDRERERPEPNRDRPAGRPKSDREALDDAAADDRRSRKDLDEQQQSAKARYSALADLGQQLSYSLRIHVALPADQGKGQLLLLVPKSSNEPPGED